MSKRRKRRTPIRSNDHAGKPIVRVPLANQPGLFAIVDAEDFDRLMAAEVSDQWCWRGDGNGNHYAMVWFRGRHTTVARLILEVVGRTVVAYDDGDRRNLRRENLRKDEGFSKFAAVISDADDGNDEW